MDSSIKKFLLLAPILFSILTPAPILAAALYLDPAAGDFQFGQTFVVNVKIDTEGQCVNALSADVAFDPNVLKLVDFSLGGSVITLWTQMPDEAAIKQANVTGHLSFEGGMPGGYCGEAAGSAGESDSLGKLIFITPATQVSASPGPVQATVNIGDSPEVYLNDGQGDTAPVTVRGAAYTLSNGSQSPSDDWEESVKNDTTPPEQFEVKVTRDPSMFGGKYFIIFNTTDKQTGIDHYEVAETPLNSGNKSDQWTLAQSPYLLKDQKLSSTIKVKAVDDAGNQTVAQFVPGEAQIIKPEYLIYLLGVLALAAILAAAIIIKIRRRQVKHD